MEKAAGLTTDTPIELEDKEQSDFMRGFGDRFGTYYFNMDKDKSNKRAMPALATFLLKEVTNKYIAILEEERELPISVAEEKKAITQTVALFEKELAKKMRYLLGDLK